MKPFLLMIIILFSMLNGMAQKATVSNHVLMIPTDSLSTPHHLSKTDLLNVETVGSLLGDITSYELSFKLNGSLYSKDKMTPLIPGDILSKLLTLPVGSKIWFDHIVIKRNGNPGINNGSCSFILTD